MKIIIATMLIMILTYVGSVYLPWWILVVVAFVITAFLALSPWKGFVAGFLGVFTAWAITAGWIDVQNSSILSQRIGSLFGNIPPIMLIIVTGFLGGILGGVSGLSGCTISKWLLTEKQ
jgi:hypothetical protein